MFVHYPKPPPTHKKNNNMELSIYNKEYKEETNERDTRFMFFDALSDGHSEHLPVILKTEVVNVIGNKWICITLVLYFKDEWKHASLSGMVFYFTDRTDESTHTELNGYIDECVNLVHSIYPEDLVKTVTEAFFKDNDYDRLRQIISGHHLFHYDERVEPVNQ